MPESAATDLRGFEWHYLWGLYQRSLAVPTFAADGPVTSLAFSPDGGVLAIGARDFTAKLYDIATGTLLHSLSHESDVQCVAFSPDSTRIADDALSEVCFGTHSPRLERR